MKSVWGNLSPSLKIPDCVDSYWNDWVGPQKNSKIRSKCACILRQPKQNVVVLFHPVPPLILYRASGTGDPCQPEQRPWEDPKIPWAGEFTPTNTLKELLRRSSGGYTQTEQKHTLFSLSNYTGLQILDLIRSWLFGMTQSALDQTLDKRTGAHWSAGS